MYPRVSIYLSISMTCVYLGRVHMGHGNIWIGWMSTILNYTYDTFENFIFNTKDIVHGSKKQNDSKLKLS